VRVGAARARPPDFRRDSAFVETAAPHPRAALRAGPAAPPAVAPSLPVGRPLR
jgi:hypothetical protein